MLQLKNIVEYLKVYTKEILLVITVNQWHQVQVNMSGRDSKGPLRRKTLRFMVNLDGNVFTWAGNWHSVLISLCRGRIQRKKQNIFISWHFWQERVFRFLWLRFDQWLVVEVCRIPGWWKNLSLFIWRRRRNCALLSLYSPHLLRASGGSCLEGTMKQWRIWMKIPDP